MPASPTKLLFTWEETTLLQQELMKFRTAFVAKYGAEWYMSFRGDDLDFATVQNELVWGGMFSTKKLIVIRSVPKDNHPDNKAKASDQGPLEEWIIKNREDIPSDHVLIFVSYKPDKRTKGAKFFLENATVKEFPLLNEKQLAHKAQDLLTKYIDGVTATQLIAYIWVNGGVGTLTRECEKLIHYAEAKDLSTITLEHIKDVCVASKESDAFALMDTLFLDTPKAIQCISDEQNNGKEPLEFLGLLFRGLKMIIAMVDCYDNGITWATDIAKEIGVHHFPVMKRLGSIKIYKTKIAAIKSCYGQLLQLNYDLITGGLPVEGFWLEVKKVVSEG
jgi:DNA polymerase III delta subunit